MINILHISAHLGGGVGRVLLSYLDKINSDIHFNHSIYCLDTINKNAKAELLRNDILFDECMSAKQGELLRLIALADIVVIHWWNHPLLYDFMVRYTLPQCRLVIWSHVSGNKPPQVFSKALFDYPDYFVFTTPMSYLNSEVKSYQKDQNKFKVIWSTGGLDHVKNVRKKKHNGFNIGYIGTVDFSKMYPNFVQMCSKIDIQDVKFIVCGTGHVELLQEQANQLGVAHKFEFTGHIDDIGKYLGQFDVFGYPLNRGHYGTCDQALAEAMGCGIVPIVFDNLMECHMVNDMSSGLVVKDEVEYIRAMIELYENISLRDSIAKKAKEEALKRFSIDVMIEEWKAIFIEIMNKRKTSKSWGGKYSGMKVKSYQIFLESIGKYADKFESNNIKEISKLLHSSSSWQSRTKGSLKHYSSFFDDKQLKLWSEFCE